MPATCPRRARPSRSGCPPAASSRSKRSLSRSRQSRRSALADVLRLAASEGEQVLQRDAQELGGRFGGVKTDVGREDDAWRGQQGMIGGWRLPAKEVEPRPP